MRKSLKGMCWLILAAGAAGCSSDTALFLTIDSALNVPAELDTITIGLTSGARPLLNQDYPLKSRDELPATLLVKSEGDAEAAVHIAVAGLKDGRKVAGGAADTAFVSGKTIDVRITLVTDPSGGEDAGHAGRDAGVDAGGDTGVDAATDAGLDDVADASLEDAGDAGSSDAGHDAGADASHDANETDAGLADAAEDAGDDAAPADGAVDGGFWVGQPCAADIDCGEGKICFMSETKHGACSIHCEDAGCGAGARCLNMAMKDAGFLCAKECSRHADCARKDYGCSDLLDAGSALCLPNMTGDGGVLEYPRVAIEPELANPAVTDPDVQLVAVQYDEEHHPVSGVTFSWMSSEASIAKPVALSPGVFEPLAAGVVQVTAQSNIDALEGHATVEVEAVMETLAGSGAQGDADGTGAAATFNSMEHIVIDKLGNAYVSDRRISGYFPVIRRIAPDGVVTTFATPANYPQCKDGPVQGTAEWGDINGLAIDAFTGEIYFSDAGCNGFRKISQGQVTTVFKTDKGFADGDAVTGRMDSPGVLKLVPGAIIFFDTNNRRIRSLSLTDHTLSTLAGTGTQGYKDGPASEADLDDVRGLDAIPGGAVYFTDFSNHVVRILEGGSVATISGSGQKGFKDGPAAQALFEKPNGIFYYRDELIITESGNHRIRRIESNIVSTLACDWSNQLVDGKKSKCAMFYPSQSAMTADGHVITVDFANFAIRKLQISK